jgi:hypothetical protein
MQDSIKPYTMITDYITGKEVPNIGAEENRQAVERFLVDNLGYSKNDIAVDVDIEMTVGGESYKSQIDMIVSPDGGITLFMAVKCAAGSLGSREREILAAARLFDPSRQIPISVVSDGKAAVILDTVSGKKLGRELKSIPSKKEAVEKLKTIEFVSLSDERREREGLIFRTYDKENVNVQRNL